jgi:hypothetical protein
MDCITYLWSYSENDQIAVLKGTSFPICTHTYLIDNTSFYKVKYYLIIFK